MQHPPPPTSTSPLVEGDREDEAPAANGPAPRAGVRAALASVSWLDRGLLLIAFAASAYSLLCPYGHDQGLYHYVARSWFQDGQVPYRDVFDHKTPGIYVIYGILMTLFGQGQWVIRAADIACVFTMGILAPFIMRREGEAVPRGAIGTSTLVAVIFHYAYLISWDTAQTEIWVALFFIVSLAVLRYVSRSWLALAIVGMLGGLAVLTKPPAVFGVAVVFVLAYLRLRRESAPRRRVVTLCAGMLASAALPVITTFAYFAAKHALPAMAEVVVGANSYYAQHERKVSSLSDVFDYHVHLMAWFEPLGLVLVTAATVVCLVVGRDRRASALSGYAIPLAALAAVDAGLIMQLKFFHVHFVAFIAPLVLFVSVLQADLTRLIGDGQRKTARATLALCTLAILSVPLSAQSWIFGNSFGNAWRYATGSMSREDYEGTFTMTMFYYYNADSQSVGRWIRDHSSREDFIVVRGFSTEIYQIAERRYTGRFFWTNFITDPRRSWKHDEWLKEDQDAFARNPPRYVVTLATEHAGIESAEYYEALGYHRVYARPMLVVLERGPAPGAAAP